MSRSKKNARTADLGGLVVAITGGGRGIGRATAEAFVAAGCRVAIGDIDVTVAEETAKEIGATAFAVDVSKGPSFATFLDLVEAALGPVDVLVNNAGIMPLGPFHEEPDEVSERIIDINLKGAVNGTKQAMRRMLPRGRGHIVNVASAVGRFAVPNATTYSASKFGVIGVTQGARLELRGTGIEASVVLPTNTRTELVDGLGLRKGAGIVEPHDVAAAIVGVVRRPRFETWVPHRDQKRFRITSLLPYQLLEDLAYRSGELSILKPVDEAARAAYEKRARD